MRVVFLAPAYPPEMVQYTRGLIEVGAEVYGVADSPVAQLPEAVRRQLSGYLKVPRIMDEEDVLQRVALWVHGKGIDRVVSNWEPLVILAAKIRERLGMPGMSVDTVRGFRDKELMKERVRAAGLRVPRSRRVRTEKETRDAAEEIGFPLILKPIAGAGSADTYRVTSPAELDDALHKMRGIPEASCEEYVEGEEFTFDTVCIGGRPAYENVAAYLPKPIEMRSIEWISPVIITVREMGQPKLAPGVELGRNVLRALHMGDGFTHMEWFLTPKGEAVFGEIACRPGGAHLVDQMNYTSDIDLFREWARVACWRTFDAVAPRKYNAGIVFKRAVGQGRVTRIEGLGDWISAAGHWVVEEQLLRPGTPRRNWKQTLLSDGHVLVRHPQWDEAYRLSFLAATGIKMYAE
jgi:biotin carboxylase